MEDNDGKISFLLEIFYESIVLYIVFTIANIFEYLHLHVVVGIYQ